MIRVHAHALSPSPSLELPHVGQLWRGVTFYHSSTTWLLGVCSWIESTRHSRLKDCMFKACEEGARIQVLETRRPELGLVMQWFNAVHWELDSVWPAEDWILALKGSKNIPSTCAYVPQDGEIEEKGLWYEHSREHFLFFFFSSLSFWWMHMPSEGKGKKETKKEANLTVVKRVMIFSGQTTPSANTKGPKEERLKTH